MAKKKARRAKKVDGSRERKSKQKPTIFFPSNRPSYDQQYEYAQFVTQDYDDGLITRGQ